MSGAEADISSDGETSFEDEDVPLPPSPLKEGTDEPFEVILKGGRPWGFTLVAGAESKASIQIAEIAEEGRAADNGRLKIGDYILQVNDVRCSSLIEAQDLIEGAFRTLALQVWRGTSEPLSSPVRSASFLQKARELSERARQQASVQDDSSLFSESKAATSLRMKPRQRRIESFHGSRRGSSGHSSGSPSTASPRVTAAVGSLHTPPVTSTHTPPTTTESAESTVAKPGLKGWATEQDLTWSRKPVIMSGSHATASSRHTPLTLAKSSPSLHQVDVVNPVTTPRGYTPKSPLQLNVTKSTPDIPDQVNNYENITSPTSPKSPSWYQQQKLPNRSSVFDFSTPTARRSAGSPRNSYSGTSPRNSYAGGSPRNSYGGGSPRNSYSGYSPTSGYPQTSVTGFSPMSVPVASTSAFSSPIIDASGNHRSSGSYGQNQKLTGANSNSYDDTPTHVQNKNYDRRSLPPQTLYNYRQDYQKENNKLEPPKTLTSMPVTREEEELDKEVRDIKPQPPNDLDLRPMYSPPAPPVRDISSLKYVKYSQNHEKFPSWPVTMANPPQNVGPPVDVHLGDKKSDKDSGSDKSDSQMSKSSDKSRKSPSGEKRGSEDNKQPRNQSDPGFKQKRSKPFYTQRKPMPKEQNYENLKSDEERFDEFYRHSKPGYPPPKLDPDGHNYGDEKYSIPSPPERDMPNLDQKSLVEKIAAVISPNSHPSTSSYQYQHHYIVSSDNNTPRSQHNVATSPLSSTSKIPGMYFQQAINSQNLLRPNMSQNKNMVDSGTSPIGSPGEERGKLRTISANPRTDSFMSPTDKSRGLIIRQMPYYNTSTQTDENLDGQSKMDIGSETMSASGPGSELFASNARSEMSSQSSGIGSMNFSDHHSAPLLRKLSEEFYRGKLSGTMPNEKRLSSASAYDDLKSPRSESHYGSGLKEAESCSSVVIHSHEPSGPFGGDDFGSSPSLTSSKHEGSDMDNEFASDHRLTKSRHSMDAALILQKSSGSMSMPPRSLQDSRFTSENNLSSGNSYNQRSYNHSQSLLHLNRPQSAMADAPSNRFTFNSNSSSSSSRPGGSMEARSSGSRLSSDSSMSGIKPGSRHNSDNVFDDKSAPAISDSNRPASASDNRLSVGIGRKESMKHAFGTFDENEHHYATPYAHQRNSSEVLSPNARDQNTAHGRSMSFDNYMPMNYNQHTPDRTDKLGQIQEEGSEIRWQEAVRKSKSLSRETGGNYENVQLGQTDNRLPARGSDSSDQSEVEKKKETKMRRTVSEQIRPRKNDQKQQRRMERNKEQNKDYTSSSGESTKGNKSDGESISSMTQHLSDSELKRMQQKAVLDFVERKKRGSDSSDPNSPIRKDQGVIEFSPTPPVSQSPVMMGSSSPPPQPQSPLSDITKRYNYTKAQRNESLRRTRSISSNSSRDSTTDYVDMKRLDRNYQTEWSRLRSQDGAMPRRPLSIGSDISGVDYLATSSPVPMSDGEIHTRSMSEPDQKQVDRPDQTVQDPQSQRQNINPSPSNDAMVTSPIYHNLAGDYPRRPPPPIPGVNDEAPPALPPRSYHKFSSSKSESFLLAKLDPQQAEGLKQAVEGQGQIQGQPKWEGGTGTLREDAYAQQLRRQARRFSEQQHIKPMSMQVVSTKQTMQVSLSQSYKQEPTQVLEAVPVQNMVTSTDNKGLHHSPTPRDSTKSPLPPPLPTPLKNGEVEIAPDLNTTADFPPPPVEFLGSELTSVEQGDRCADDSYGSYKSRAAPREVGKYKRAVSDSNVIQLHQDQQKYRPLQDLNSKDVAETPNKPPRKKLELQGRSSPIQRSNSPSMPGKDNQLTNPMSGPQVPMYQSAEVSMVSHVQKSMAKPLSSAAPLSSAGKTSSQQPSSSSSSGSFIGTVVQRPSSLAEDPSLSVMQRVKKIEVIAHSPTSSKPQSVDSPQVSGTTLSTNSPPQRVSDSLERLESSVVSSDSFKDRLRPVVKKSESEMTESQSRESTPRVTERLHGSDVTDRCEISPPQLPSRTYRQTDTSLSSSVNDRPPRPSSKPSDSPHRRNSFQNRNPGNLNHPRPYENKSGANVHSPVGQSSYSSHARKPGPRPESQRSPGQSVPEPQVPSRLHPMDKHSRGGVNEQYSDKRRDPNESLPSPEQKLSSNYNRNSVPNNRDNTQNRSVHNVKHNNDSNSNSYSSSPKIQNNNSTSHLSNKDASSVSPKNHHIDRSHSHSYQSHSRQRDNSHSDNKNRGNDSQRPEMAGDHSNEQRRRSHDPRSHDPSHDQKSSPQTITYHRGDFKNWKTDQSRADNQQNVPNTINLQTSNSFKNSNKSDHHNVDNSKHSVSNNQVKSHMDYTPTEKVSAPSLVTINHTRQQSAEELECDTKAQELAKVLQDSDKALSSVLQSDSSKSRMQYMDGLFTVDNTEETEVKRPRSASKKEDKEEKKEEDEQKEPTSPMPVNYYVSPPKAMIELEIRKFGDTSLLTQDIGDGNNTLAQKKEELLQRMVKKVEILKEDKSELLTDIEDNDNLGRQVSSIVEKKCLGQHEKDKYRSYIEDIDKIIRLLLKLSGLLARAENTIQGLNDNTNEKIKKMTFDKRDRLHRQHEEAKVLKVDIDKRSEQVENILHECLSPSELDDYHYFIKMKSKYTIQMQELEDKITLGSEQIGALQKSIPAKGKS